jgi:hypothetical protein
MRSAVVLLVLLAACTGRAPTRTDPIDAHANEPAVVREARVQFPRVIEMHQKIVSRSCAPNAGVCHNTSNYPDLSTTGALLETVGSWCNLQMPDPTQGFDLCERKGDLIVIPSVMITEIASLQRDAVDHWTIGLRDAPDVDVTAASLAFFEEVPNKPVLQPSADWQMTIDITAGEKIAHVNVAGVADDPFVQEYIDDVMASLTPGDPNENGVFGADDRADDDGAAVIEPGSLARSYLWGRITGTVPGSRMPLANQPLSDAEYVAVACFIETLGADAAPEAAIDYDHCDFAKDPQSLAVAAAP